MPAQVADWPEVKATAIQIGSLKRAAEVHGIEYAAVRMRASRENWPVGRRVHKQAKAAVASAHQQIVRASEGRVASVTSAADAAVAVLECDEGATRLSLSATARRLAKESESAPITLETTADVLNIAKLYAITHRINQGVQVGVQVNLGRLDVG